MRLPGAPRCNIRRRLRATRAGFGRHDKPGGRRGGARGPLATARRAWAGRAVATVLMDKGGIIGRATAASWRTARSACRAASRPDQAQRPADGARRPDAALEATARRACRFVLVDDALVACCASPRPDRRRRSRHRAGARGPGGGARPPGPASSPPPCSSRKNCRGRARTDRSARGQAAAALATRQAGTANLHNDQHRPRRLLGGPRPARRRGYLRGARRLSLQAVGAAWRFGVAPDDV